MANNIGSKTVTLKTVDASSAIFIDCNPGAEMQIRFNRVAVNLDKDGQYHSTDSSSIPQVARSRSQIEKRDFGGMTGGEIMDKLIAMGDIFRKEDITAEIKRHEEMVETQTVMQELAKSRLKMLNEEK